MSHSVPVTAVSDVPSSQATEVTAGSQPVAEHTTSRATRAPRHDEAVVAAPALVRLAGTV